MTYSANELHYLATQHKVKSFFVFFVLASNHLLKSNTPEFHKDIVRYYLRSKICVLAAPRSHAKTVVTLMYVLWKLFKSERVFDFAVWISSTNSLATKVGGIALEALLDEDLQKIFKVEIISKNKEQIEFTIEGKKRAIYFDGIFGKTRGINYKGERPSVVVCDDVENDENVRSSDQRKKLDHVYKSNILSLGDGDTQYILIGTVLHFDSLLSNQLKKNESLFFATTPENPLWPDRFGKKELDQKKKELGSLVFAQEYENRPMSVEDQIIKEEWISYGSNIDTKNILSVDPASSKKDSADNSGLLLVGKHGGKFYVKDDFSGKYSPTELVDKIILIYKNYRVDYVLIEEIAYQSAVKDWLLRESQKQNISIPIKTIKPNKDKVTRLLSVSHFFENNVVFLEKPVMDLVNELLGFPAYAHDDRVDALTQAIEDLKAESMMVKEITARRKINNW